MEQIIIVSNRLPVTITSKNQELTVVPSAGGLATGLNSIFEDNNNALWIGWPGFYSNVKVKGWDQALESLRIHKMAPVMLTKLQVKAFYEGFSNSTLWPLFHYFPRYTVFIEKQWEIYKEVNALFCAEILKHANEDTILWIHDYHLLLLPGMIREKLPNAKIGYFNHIPFPAFEIFRILPTRQEILKGMMGADLIGFHTYDDVKHFLTSANRILGLDNKMGELRHEDRIVYTDAFPMGINYNQIRNSGESVPTQIALEEYCMQCDNVKVILSIDRLDYSKGIPERLKAFDLFLQRNPAWKGKVTLMMIVAPSREKVAMYKKLKTEIDELVGQINARHRTMAWSPIMYFYRSFPFDTLPALYKIADIALITPLRDGMNLVCKEYVASRTDQTGVLILSEMAGASKELHEACIINPYDLSQTSEAIKEALNMPLEEQKRRMREMQKNLQKYDVKNWIKLFMEKLQEVHKKQKELSLKEFTPKIFKDLIKDYGDAESRKLFLDYDGTLVPLKSKPEYAHPDNQLLNLLKTISSDPKNKVVIISGRDKDSLGSWFKDLPGIDLIAEHGFWRKKDGCEWVSTAYASDEWKIKLMQILEVFINRTPGTFIEEKSNSLAWHYRNADLNLGEGRSRELIDLLQYLTTNLQLNVLEGKKVVEVKNSDVNKGTAILEWINEEDDFILAAGDDWTDEDMFRIMPERAFTIKIGFSPSFAKYNLLAEKGDPSHKMRNLLKALSEVHVKENQLG
jgi:trehalose 6-phosphate synthase/phosphatase